MARVRLFGLTIDSGLPVPGPAATSPADIIVRHRSARGDEIFADYETHVDADGTIDIQHDGIRFLLSGGNRIEVVAPRHVEEGLIVAWLTGVAFGALLLQRGLLPIHANAVCMPGSDGIAAFAGPSGAGKSTLAARLSQDGYDLFCDDLLGVRIAGDRTMAVRGIPRLRLWGETLDHLGIDRCAARQIVDGVEKYEVLLAHDVDEVAERPLARFYILEASEDDAVTIERLPGAEAGRAVLDNCYRWRISAALHSEQWAFDRCIEIARSVEVFRVRRPWSLDREREAYDLIDRHLRA